MNNLLETIATVIVVGACLVTWHRLRPQRDPALAPTRKPVNPPVFRGTESEVNNARYN